MVKVSHYAAVTKIHLVKSATFSYLGFSGKFTSTQNSTSVDQLDQHISLHASAHKNKATLLIMMTSTTTTGCTVAAENLLLLATSNATFVQQYPDISLAASVNNHGCC